MIVRQNRAKMNIDKTKENYEMDQKCFIAWSPLEKKDFSFKHRYITCSRSVPHKSKRLAKYRLSRSLNFDASVCNSNSENSSFEEDKHLSRSAKIMRALNFNSSPSYYGKTKIKKSLNFNLTPSPKSFRHVKKGIRKSLSLNFNSPLSVPNKYLSLNDNPSDSANSSLLFSSSDSIDENQNETPLQQSTKEHEMLHYSTPNAKYTRKSSCHSATFTPLLRSRLKETIDNIVYVAATPNSQSLKRVKGRTKYTNNITMNTSRNLLHEFHDKDDSRSCTPKNLICIIPESMSAIKRSHKKERSSRRSDGYTTQFTDSFVKNESILQDRFSRYSKQIDPIFQDSRSDIEQCANRSSNELVLSHSEDDMSDTGSLFDYTEEQKHIFEESKNVSEWKSNYTSVIPKIDKFDGKVKLEENVDCFSRADTSNRSDIDASNSCNENIDLANGGRSVTPEPVKETVSESQKSVTPENRINILQTIGKDSIKKSHKKIKDNNKRRLFSPKVLQDNVEATEKQENGKCSENIEQYESTEENKISIEVNNPDVSRDERSSTPDKVSSSRLLLSQFSSVKKSHKKDKHNKILCGFLKRQEYFNKDMDLVTNNKYEQRTFNDEMSECKNSIEDFRSDLDVVRNIEDSTSLVASASLSSSLDKLSPSKRKKAQNISPDREKNVSYDFELQELDRSKEEFKIFTPLKRKRSLFAFTVAKEYTHFYDLTSEKNERPDDTVASICFSRCLTPVLNFPNSCVKSEKDDIITKSDDNADNGNVEEVYDSNCDSNDVTGRLTPRNMSTTELYPNLDSIKKSHKKNKRGNSSRKSFNAMKNNHSMDEKHETSIESVANEMYNPLEFSNDCVIADDAINKAIYDKSDDNQNCPSTSAENISPTMTPPNYLKTKAYMKLLQETSIKRSHKKNRNKRKQELVVDTNELSDDGSIFGDEEKSCFIEDRSKHD
ncbi:uncharacterized protein LOC126915066 [Bombus affinis]|uniref:uncharacterized protein LOC126915066 n=1 Tax=Bombus affinis TaxID=309941 RepID=UPI0021B774A3|nr:uncharacterized protein LOC126915066 [Bombus affinis]XP_050575373.1 uncharacterized protein LOC126915066 [Bombus affinis]XP_050575374.1 uncharacterized protein LOC126915066 [Bombus affinis]